MIKVDKIVKNQPVQDLGKWQIIKNGETSIQEKLLNSEKNSPYFSPQGCPLLLIPTIGLLSWQFYKGGASCEN